MITMLMQGGHGNQLFQWAFGLAQAKRLNTRLQLNTSRLGGARPFTLNQWEMPKIDVPYQTQPTVREQGMPYNPTLVSVLKKGDVVQGYFQSEKYLAGIEEELRALRPRVTDNPLLEAIFNCANPVAVHVRRGDYLKEPHASFHGNLGMDYYNAAMERVAYHSLCHPVFFIFSDDPQWCRENFKDCVVVEPRNEATDIYSMSLCYQAILANSSFSWWGAYLGDYHKNRTVIAPKNWFASGEEDPRDIVPERWIKL